MAAHVVYQAVVGDGYQPNYVELIIDDAGDLSDLQVSVGGALQSPAPGSIAYLKGAKALYHFGSDGDWHNFEEGDV